ncbi:MAG: hypothetical protein QXD89_02215 [Candidatus Aenigmatarchaeota archaeon]
MSIKSQTFTYDFFIALSVFLIVVFFIISFFEIRIEKYSEYWKFKSMEEFLIDASNVWFTEGDPIYWSLENINQLGLSNSGEINSTKVDLINNISYSKFLYLIKAYNLNVKYEVYENDKLVFDYPKLEVKGKNVVFLERYAIWNKSIVKVRTIVWD